MIRETHFGVAVTKSTPKKPRSKSRPARAPADPQRHKPFKAPKPYADFPQEHDHGTEIAGVSCEHRQ
jgi:hypothetical protein